jgi:cell fate (sporulation/competence/biofilm development) regulator YlbF (YheA/YmcA/DUF963 family)
VNKLENKAKDLNKALKELEVSKEYFSLKEKINNDEYSKKLLEVIKQTQNDMKSHLKNNDIKSYKASKQTLELLKQEFYELPLINNYIIVKNELNDILEQVVNILSE